MQNVALSYQPVLIFLGIALAVTTIILLVPMFLAPNHPDSEKTAPYECGFESFGDARATYDVRFHLVAILFLIFDIELVFLFPWIVSFDAVGGYGFWSVMIFLAVLTVGFVYEWRKGALDWT